MPEQAEAGQAAAHDAVQPEPGGLVHHHRQPHQAGGDVQAVGAHQGEIGGQEGAAARPGVLRDQVRELMHLHGDEAGADQEGHGQPGDDLVPPAGMHVQHA